MGSLSEAPLATQIVRALTRGEEPLYHVGTSGSRGSETIFVAPFHSNIGERPPPAVPEILRRAHPGFPGTVSIQQTGDTDPVTIVVERGRGGESATIFLHSNSDSAHRAYEASERYDGRGTS